MKGSGLLISIDVETFGPIPGPNSMINLGAVAYTTDRRRLGTFNANLLELEGSQRDEDTMVNFWLKPEQADALSAITQNQLPPGEVMAKFRDWIDEVNPNGNKVVLVAYPSGFDFLWVYWYWQKFLKCYPPFWFKCIDIQTFAHGRLGIPFADCTKGKALAPFCPKDAPHTHIGADDAEEQIQIYFNVRDAQ
jgi:hypothetical protein